MTPFIFCPKVQPAFILSVKIEIISVSLRPENKVGYELQTTNG